VLRPTVAIGKRLPVRKYHSLAKGSD